MNQPSILLGAASVEDDDYFKEMTGKIIATREWFKDEMRSLGFTFPDSKANFLFATHESVPAREIFEAARAENIYVRYFPKERIDNYLRITIGPMKKWNDCWPSCGVSGTVDSQTPAGAPVPLRPPTPSVRTIDVF